ncbi:MAG: ribonuclease J [Clostridia bacterium]|nr:ribonuclease J [Clostridia bacterium]
MVYTNKKVFNIQNQKQKTKTPRNYSKNQKSGGAKEKISGPNVKISFLGGVGEIGKNMTVFETEKDIVIIDAGLTFPGDDLPGVDIIVPDISYLLENKHKVRGIIITHGHEDHIGGLPYVLNELKIPVYGSKLTLALIESKLREFKGVEFQGVEVKPKTIVKIGSDFSAEFIRVSHSISGAYAICLNTPAGNIVHTGDFKIDYTPVRGDIIDLTRFGELGKKGVNLLMCESTNVCREGYSMSESNVGRVLEEVAFKKHPEKRLIISTFASNIHRLQQIMTLAEKYKRKIAFTGRSMINVSEVAMKVGELYFKKENIIDIDKVGKYADSELVLVSTGSQGEPMSALTRLADDEFKKVKLTENDCVVLSASPIPGNEKNVYNVINKLIKKGIEVIFDEIADVHTSGHACQEEIKTIHSLVRPRFFIPVHGEYRHLKVHKDVAVAMGMPERNVLIADLGTQFVMTPTVVKKLGEVKAGSRIIDGKVISDYNSVVLKERKQLSEDGFIVAITKISKKTADLEEEPLVITRGFAYDNEGGLLKQLKTNIAVCVKKYDIKETEQSFLNNELRKFISNFVFKRTGRRPIIISTTMIV